MIVVVMGVAGSGKSTIGRLLATSLGWKFFDADDFHSEANVAKMRSGIALSDADREPWLLRLNALLRELAVRGEDAVLACSALRESFRQRLAEGAGELRFVLLKGAPELVEERLIRRPEHFFDPALLETQYEALEEPREAIAVDAAKPPDAIVSEIRAALRR